MSGVGLGGAPVEERLWPEPALMHSNLDRWVSFIKDLENRYATEVASHAVTKSSLSDQVTRLKSELETQTVPYVNQIRELEGRLAAQQVRIDYQDTEIKEALIRLAKAMEVHPETKGLTLMGIIDQALLLIDEARRQFRDSL